VEKSTEDKSKIERLRWRRVDGERERREGGDLAARNTGERRARVSRPLSWAWASRRVIGEVVLERV
jgi:hypothetical protein